MLCHPMIVEWELSQSQSSDCGAATFYEQGSEIVELRRYLASLDPTKSYPSMHSKFPRIAESDYVIMRTGVSNFNVNHIGTMPGLPFYLVQKKYNHEAFHYPVS